MNDFNSEIKKGKIKLIHCYSFKFNDTEKNYGIFDKELLAILRTLEHSKYFLRNTQWPIGILTDNKALSQSINGMPTKLEISRRLRYKERLLQFNTIGGYIRGSTNTLADVLSRPSN